MLFSHRRFVLFLIIALIYLLKTGVPAVHADLKLAATVIAERGDVQIERLSESGFRPLLIQDNLYVGDTIRTSSTGEAEILFVDGSQVKIGASSAFKVLEKFNSVHKESLLQAIVGIFWAHLRPGQSISTPSANIVVRGTEVAIDVAADGTSAVTVLTGDVTFGNDKGTVELEANQQSTAHPGEAPSAPVVVDPSGLISWTGDIVGLPLDYETPDIVQLATSASSAQASEASLTAQTAQTNVDPGVWIQLGNLRRVTGDATGAISAYHSALKIQPTDEKALTGIALTYLSVGQIDLARSVLFPIAANPDAVAITGLIDLETGNVQAASTELGNAVAADPSLYSAEDLLALIHLQEGNSALAQSEALSAVSVNAQSAQTQGTLSTVYFFEGNLSEARQAASAALSIDPDSPFALLAEGRVYVAHHDFEPARVDFEKALAFAPRLWLVHDELAQVYEQIGDPHKAAEEYNDAVALYPSCADSYAGLGTSDHEIGQDDAAMSAFAQAVALAPSSASVGYYYASFLVDSGHLDEALKELKEFAGEDSQFGLLYARLAEIYLYKQDLYTAQSNARKAVKLLPESAIAHYELGRVYYEEQHTYQAEQEFRIATVLDNRLAAARYALGLVQEKTESGLLTSFSNIFDSAFIGSPESSQSLNNLQTPGADERVLAAVEDPTAVRSATRSYGDTEINAIAGDQPSHDVSASYLTNTNKNSGVAGVSAESEFTHGVRKDDDNTNNTASFIVGQSAQDKPIGYVLLGSYEQDQEGLDSGAMSDPDFAQERYNRQVTGFTAGFNAKAGPNGRLLGILQANDNMDGQPTSLSTSNTNYYTDHLDTDLFGGELRYDEDTSTNNRVIGGFSYGNRSRVNEGSFNLYGPPPLNSNQFETIKPLQGYIRDELNVGRLWSYTFEAQYIQEFPTGHATLTGGLYPPFRSRDSKDVVLPYFIADYKPDSSTVVRLRYHRIAASQEDFQLLQPDDDFLISYADLPTATDASSSFISTATSTELEIDRTFSGGFFASLGAFRQDSQMLPAFGGAFACPKGRVQGVQTSFQGAVGKYVSYFILGEFANSEEESPYSRYPGTPNFEGIGTVQYLSRMGMYGQLAYYYQGDQVTSDTDPSIKGAFGVLDLRIGKRFGLRTNIFGELNNVFNKQYEISGDEQPGTELRVGISERN